MGMRQRRNPDTSITFSIFPGRSPAPNIDLHNYPVPLPRDNLPGVYIISVAARLLEMHPQTLRKYERLRLIRPSRTVGMLRLYSEEDISRLRMIKHLVEERGMNLAGVELALDLVERLLGIQQLVDKVLSTNKEAQTQIQRYLDNILESLHFPTNRS